MKTSREKGNAGESCSEKYLRRNKYSIIERNFNSIYGEIDIIASIEHTIVFVEVKLRKIISTAMSSLSAAKKKRIIRTSLIFLQNNPQYEDYYVRYDLIAVIDSQERNEYVIKHIPNAFFADEVCYEL